MEYQVIIDVNKQPNVDFLFRKGGESLTSQDINDIRNLSLKYNEFKMLRFALLGEVDPNFPHMFHLPEEPAFNYLGVLDYKVDTNNNFEHTDVDQADLPVASRIIDKLRGIAETEASLVMELYTQSVTRSDIVSVYKNYLNKVRVLFGGELTKPGKSSITEAEMRAEGETKSIFDGMSELDLNRRAFKGKRLFTYMDSDSATKMVEQGEENKRAQLEKIQKEIKEYAVKWLNEIFRNSREQTIEIIEIELPLRSDKDTGLRVGDMKDFSLNNGMLKFSLATEDPNLEGFNGITRSFIFTEIAMNKALREKRFKGYHAADSGYYFLFALAELNENISKALSDPKGKSIISTPFENPLAYLSGFSHDDDRTITEGFRVGKNGKTRFNSMGFQVLSSWFFQTRINAADILLYVYQKDGMGPALLVRQKEVFNKAVEKLIDIQFDNLEKKSSDSAKEEKEKASIGTNFRNSLVRLKIADESNSNIDVDTSPPSKQDSASIIEKLKPKQVSFEIENPQGLNIDYLASYPDDGVRLHPYVLPDEISGEEHLLRAKRPIPVYDRTFRVWAPLNCKITDFILTDEKGNGYRLGTDYELEVDERGYYSAHFKLRFTAPKSVKYSLKFTLDPEKIDQVELDSQALLNLGVVAEKLGSAGYTKIQDNIEKSIKKGEIKTTGDLERIVLESSLYYFQELYSASTISDIKTNHYPFLPEAADNGKLVMVCSHASLLMKSILSDVFPRGDTHRTLLLVLQRNPLGNRLYSTESFHSTLRGKINGRNIAIDATPSKPAFRVSVNTFVSLKERFIGIFKRRQKGMVKVVSKAIQDNSFNTFVVVSDQTRLERANRNKQQYFLGLYKTYIDTLSSYEKSIMHTVQFRPPNVVVDISEMLKKIETEFNQEKPDIAQFRKRISDLKEKLEFNKRYMISGNRREVLAGKAYLGNAIGYIGFLEDFLNTLESRL